MASSDYQSSSVSRIKRAKRESLIYRCISKIYAQTALDDPRLRELVITHVRLSTDKSVAFVYFFCQAGEEKFAEVLKTLVLYKPSMRKVLAKEVPSRYVPDLRFKFDDQVKKQMEIEGLLDSVKKDPVDPT